MALRNWAVLNTHVVLKQIHLASIIFSELCYMGLKGYWKLHQAQLCHSRLQSYYSLFDEFYFWLPCFSSVYVFLFSFFFDNLIGN